MQPADDKESVQATKKLIQTGVCLFDLSKNGARLKRLVHVVATLVKRISILSLGKQPVVDGQSGKIEDFFGDVIFGGCMIVQP